MAVYSISAGGSIHLHVYSTSGGGSSSQASIHFSFSHRNPFFNKRVAS